MDYNKYLIVNIFVPSNEKVRSEGSHCIYNKSPHFLISHTVYGNIYNMIQNAADLDYGSITGFSN